MFDQLNQIDLWAFVQKVIEVVVNGGALSIAAFAIIAFFILLLWGGEKAVYRFKRLMIVLRTTVDEPSDLFVQWYAQKTGRKPEDVSRDLKNVIDEFMKNFPGVVVEGQAKQTDVPPQEINVKIGG